MAMRTKLRFDVMLFFIDQKDFNNLMFPKFPGSARLSSGRGVAMVRRCNGNNAFSIMNGQRQLNGMGKARWDSLAQPGWDGGRQSIGLVPAYLGGLVAMLLAGLADVSRHASG